MTRAVWDEKGRLRYVARATREAALLGHDWVGAPHLLLAVLNGSSDARLALERAGLRLEEFRAKLVGGTSSSEPVQSLGRSWLSPEILACLGMADGLALARGEPSANDEDVVIALCFGSWGVHPNLFALADGAPEGVLAELRVLGIDTPAVDPPATSDPPRGDRVRFPTAYKAAVLQAVARVAPPQSMSTWWGSAEPGTEWVQGPQGSEVRSAVESAIRESQVADGSEAK